jgi:excinuclease ABC subunit C
MISQSIDNQPENNQYRAEKEAPHRTTIEELLLEQAKKASTSPGVYLMRDVHGDILYIGKALNLKKRVQSYFQSGRPHDPKTKVLLSKITGFETIQTLTEKEAFILESNLIKRHRPRYNVILKDDKRYPSLRLDLSQRFPELEVVRKIHNDGALYFGPYASAGAVRETIKFVQKTFKLRKCKGNAYGHRLRPCVNYQIGLCSGVCTGQVTSDQYHQQVKEVVAFLKGRTPELIKEIRQQMQLASQSEEYERAAQLRDKMFALEKTLERQVSVSTDFQDRDAVSLVERKGRYAVTLMRVRGGFLIGARNFHFESVVESIDELMGHFLRQCYEQGSDIPPQIIANLLPSDHAFMEEYLSELRGGPVHISVPQRGEKHRLVQMALQNAERELREQIQVDESHRQLLEKLRHHLKLRSIPNRIECFDSSNLSGTNPVSAMAVMVEGKLSPEHYRRYKIKDTGKPDDYAFLNEVLRRRYGKSESKTKSPDLLLLDGGKGQISVALSVLATLGRMEEFDIAGIAKGQRPDQDKIYLPGRVNPVQFGRDTQALMLLQRIRDEAHRLAVGYQRNRRRKSALHSVFEEIPGLGPRRRQLLMKHFGTIDAVQTASIEEIHHKTGIPKRLAEKIFYHLADQAEKNKR